MIKLIRKHLNLFTFGLTVMLIGLGALCYTDKGAEIIFIQQHQNKIGNIIFKYFTYFGDGIFLITVAFLLMFDKIVIGFEVLAVYLLSSIPVQLCKQLIFSDSPRPAKFFEGQFELHQIEGVELHHFGSFPSGHSATAFALATILLLIYSDKIGYVLPLMLIACITAFSRIYLGQHFLVDIYVGSIIGFISAVLIHFLFNNKLGLYNFTILQKPIHKIK